MRRDEKLTDFPFFNVYKAVDRDFHLKNYQYGERKGRDSVAFICYDLDKTKPYLLNREYKPPVAEFIVGGFGGSLDKVKHKRNIVIEEVREEAGYNVGHADVFYVGKVLVSTQMNQFCYLYIVHVNDRMKTERAPENAVEAMATPVWVGYKGLVEAEDWKPITIVQKAIAKKAILNHFNIS